MDYEYLHVRCPTHILSLIMTNYLKDFDDLVATIRGVVKFVKSSHTKFEKFKVVMRVASIECKNDICLDVPRRWN